MQPDPGCAVHGGLSMAVPGRDPVQRHPTAARDSLTEFVLQPGPGPAVFLGAGVGITPLLSMMKVSARRGNKVTTEPPHSTVQFSCSCMFRTR